MEMLIFFRPDYIWLHKLTQNYLFFSDNLYKIIPFLRPRGRFAHLLSFVLEKNPIKSVWHTALYRAVVSSGMWFWLVYFSMFQYIFFIFSLFRKIWLTSSFMILKKQLRNLFVFHSQQLSQKERTDGRRGPVNIKYHIHDSIKEGVILSC